MRIAIIGAGAAGFFAAIQAKRDHAGALVTIYEKSDKFLSKVRISGGGRCNVTHDQRDPRKLSTNYPRGGVFLRAAFKQFSVPDTVEWFSQRGVTLKTEADGRMFPITDDSSTVIDALAGEVADLGVRIALRSPVKALEPLVNGTFKLRIGVGEVEADRVIVTTGGYPQALSYAWLEALGHRIVPPVPSLFTFNMPLEPIRELMGIAVPARVRVTGTDLETSGPVLITHWGMSGPAILRASAWGARTLSAVDYNFAIRLNWLDGASEERVRGIFLQQGEGSAGKKAENANLFQLPKRLWAFLLGKAGVAQDTVWGELDKKQRNRLVDVLTNDRYEVAGKTTFKDEFVTAGGVDLSEVDPATMQSRSVPGLYFAGEVLDIDGITGGFNFQAAWTTGHIAGKLKS